MDAQESGALIDAVDNLARFRSDEALHGIRKGLGIRAADLTKERASQPEIVPRSADRVRQFAWSALTRSPHPGAKELLLTMVDDPDPMVRLSVVQAAARTTGARAQGVLDTLSRDADERVRNEALRVLREPAAAPQTQPKCDVNVRQTLRTPIPVTGRKRRPMPLPSLPKPPRRTPRVT